MGKNNHEYCLYSGALRGIIKPNLKEVDYEMIALNFHDMHDYLGTIKKYKDHLKGTRNENNPLKRYFNFNDKLVMLSPFSYSKDKEKVSGFNDEINFLINGKNKVNLHN